jgi:hypothetical protein
VRNLCERPGCGAAAGASYGIDRASLTVWVNVITVGEREITGRLCRRHANALTVPHGWTLDDRRDPNPKLFRTAEFDSSADGDAADGDDATGSGGAKPRAKGRKRAASPPPGRRAAKAKEDVPSLFESIRRELGDGDDSAEPPATGEDGAETVDPDETQAIPWSPRLGRTVEYDDDEEKPKFGRLLGRAFGEPADTE